MSVTGILHNGSNIGKVEVDDTGNLYKLGNALNALTKNIVGNGEGVEEGYLLFRNEFKTLVGDNYKAVDMLSKLGNTGLRLLHTASALELEGLCDDTYGKNTLIFGKLRDNGSCARAGAAAHTCGDEHHIGACESLVESFHALFGCLFAYFGLRACALSLSNFFAYLNFCGRLGADKHLFVGVDCDELHTLNIRLNHAVDCVSAASADTHDLYLGNNIIFG